jgi:hypothetical protein
VMNVVPLIVAGLVVLGLDARKSRRRLVTA